MEDMATYILRPYAETYPYGSLVVSRLTERSHDNREQFVCVIAWFPGDGSASIVFDEIISSGVGQYDVPLDEMAETAIGFACYREDVAEYSCHPVDRWRPWVETWGEDVETLTLVPDGDDGAIRSAAHLREDRVNAG